MMRILIAEDEDMLSLILKDTLESKGYVVEIARNGEEALEKFETFAPLLVVLDIMMPLVNGYDVAEQIRSKNSEMPIIFLSAKSQTVDVLKGFETGANDYLKKPFSIDELIARINVLLKQHQPRKNKKEIYSLGKFEFDYKLQTLLYEEEKTLISFKEAQLLRYLAGSINETVEKKRILTELWGDNNVYNSKNMDVVITRLRHYLRHDERIRIINQRGIGYKLTVDNT